MGHNDNLYINLEFILLFNKQSLLLGNSYYHSYLIVFWGIKQAFKVEAPWNTDNLMQNLVLCPTQLWAHLATQGWVS